MPQLAQTGPKVKSSYEVLADADSERKAWLKARKGLITASNVPKILRITKGAPALWYRMAGLTELKPEDEAEYATFGKESEDFNAGTLYTRKTGRKVKRVQKLLRSIRYPWLGATLDYVVVKLPKAGFLVEHGPEDVRPWERVDWPLPAPLELKSTGAKDLWPDGEEPDLRFQAQVMAQMLVMGATWGSLSAIIGQPYLHHRWADLPRHEGLCTMIVEETQKFFESLKGGTPPVDDDESTTYALRHMAERVLKSETVRLPWEAVDWAEKLVDAKARKAEAEREERLYGNLIGTAIGVADEGELPNGGGKFSFKLVHKSAYSVKASASRQLKKVNGNGK